MSRFPRRGVQTAMRIGALASVVLWLLSGRLQASIPFWLPFVVLLALEVELVIAGMRERRQGSAARPAEQRLPDADDADLGWVEMVNGEGEPVLVPAAPLPRRRSRLPLLLVVVAGIGLFAYAYRVDQEAGWSSLRSSERRMAEMRFTAEAARVAGRPVRVVCDDGYAYTGVGSDAAGVAFIPRSLAYLQPEICRSLHRIAFEGRLGSRDAAAFAIVVLAHEAVHLRGTRSEARTECYALQEGVRLAQRLGLDATTARALMRAQLERDRSDRSIQRLDYRLPPGCRNGGSLDLRPDDSTFP